MDVSRSALIARINRKLSAEGERLRVNRSARWQSDLGNFYVVDASRNVVCQRDELAPLARELGVLRPDERADC